MAVPWSNMFKTALYLFFGIYGFLIVHYSLCKQDFENNQKMTEGQRLVQNVTIARGENSANNIRPKLSTNAQSVEETRYADKINTDTVIEQDINGQSEQENPSLNRIGGESKEWDMNEYLATHPSTHSSG